MLAASYACLLPLAGLAQESPLTITKVDGTQLTAELVAWDENGLTLKTADGTVSVDSAQLLRTRWQPSRAIQSATFLELTDGTRLPHADFEVNDRQATFATPLSEQPITLSTRNIRYVQLQDKAPSRDELELQPDGDVIVVRKKSSDAFDQLSGIIGDVSTDQVQFNWDGEEIPVKREKILALQYFHAREPQLKEPICLLNLTSGARLPLAEISLSLSEVRLTTTSGLNFSVPRSQLADADYSQGKLAYLSDLNPIDQNWTPRISLPQSVELIREFGFPRRDQSFSGSALKLIWPASRTGALDGELKTFDKGLAMRSRTTIRYRIPQGMNRFVAIAGIDPETAQEGNVLLELLVDDQTIWQGEIAGDEPPTEISIPLGKARHFQIVVDYGENLDFGDRLHLVEARFSR